MVRRRIQWVVGFVFLCGLTLTYATAFHAEQTFEKKVIQDSFKSWLVIFNGPIDEGTVKGTSVYIQDSFKRKHPVEIKTEGNRLMVQPLTAYQVGKEYTLVIRKSVRSSSKQYLDEHIYLPFELAATSKGYSKNETTSEKSTNTNVQEPSSISDQTNSKPAASAPKQLKVSVKYADYVAEISVKAGNKITDVTVNGRKMQYKGNNRFVLGMSDIQRGDLLAFRAYTGRNVIFEETHTAK